MIVKTFQARSGSHLSDKDAKRIGTYLERRFNGNVFTTEEVIAAATPQRSPIHRYFTWDRDEAARQWNLHEARMIVNAVMLVEHTDGDEEVEMTRAFHHVTEITDEGVTTGYVVEHIAWQRDDFAEQIIERAKREFLGWQGRFRQYEELRAWAIQQLLEMDKAA